MFFLSGTEEQFNEAKNNAALITDEEVQTALDENFFDFFPIHGENEKITLRDLTKKDLEDIKFEIAAERIGLFGMHGALACDSVQHHKIIERHNKRLEKAANKEK